MTQALAGINRTFDVLDRSLEGGQPGRDVCLQSISRGLRFEDVNFSYVPGRRVLRNVSFFAPAGSTTALVGPSGSGKSTLIQLLAGLYSPEFGSIYIDEVELSKVKLESLRGRLGLVFQETYLFDGSIRENVAFAAPHASEEEINYACDLAGVTNFATRLERGLDSRVGEGGVEISGGQRQLVSVARAIAASPELVLLDEPSSNLDSLSEDVVLRGVAALMSAKKTTFIVSHRLSMIQKADQILMLENGEIVERGTHAELVTCRGRYYELFRSQTMYSSASGAETPSYPVMSGVTQAS